MQPSTARRPVLPCRLLASLDHPHLIQYHGGCLGLQGTVGDCWGLWWALPPLLTLLVVLLRRLSRCMDRLSEFLGAEAFVDGGHHLFIVCELATGGDLASLLE